jgi:hypothetical protein
LIIITRSGVQRLRAVFRRHPLGIRHKGVIPPLVLRVEGQHLRAQFQYGDLAVEYVEPVEGDQIDTIPVPLDALADADGRDESPVELESVGPDRIMIRWHDRGISQTREYPVTPIGEIAPFPETPAMWTAISADVLDALAEASATCTPDNARYALDCIQLRGRTGKVIATDGHQLLVRSSLVFPWEEDLLIRGSPIFACTALGRDQPVQIGKTETHVVLRVGPWSTYHEIQKTVRFPRVEEAIPDADTVSTHIRLDPEDARFLEAAIDRLPGSDELNSPATIDVNGNLAIRSNCAENTQATELVLSRSSVDGPAIRINFNREFLSRAVRLGFREIGLSGVEAPIVCRTEHQVYAWQPLSGDAAIAPTDSSIRIESTRKGQEPTPQRTEPVTPRRIMKDRVQCNGQEPGNPGSDHSPSSEGSIGSSLATLIQDAEALHKNLTEARASTARLIAGLRRHRKQSRLLSDTLKSLRELKLTEATG